MKSLASTLLCVLLATSGGAAMAAPAQRIPTPATPAASSEFQSIRASADRAVQTPESAGALPPELQKEDLKSYAEYLKWQRSFAQSSWDWHLFSTKLLMYVVLAIVACGLGFTYIQFTRESKVKPPGPRRQKTAPGGEQPSPPPVVTPLPDPTPGLPTTVKVGPAGLEITSQVIGLLVLGFSLAFFYLYVKEVYPIQAAELEKQEKSVGTTPAPK